MTIADRRGGARRLLSALAGAGVALTLLGSGAAHAQERGSRRGPPARASGVSTIGDVFFGAGHLARTRDRIQGRSLARAAVERNRKLGTRADRAFRRPGSELGKRPPRKPKPERIRRPRRRRVPLAPSVRRIVVVQTDGTGAAAGAPSPVREPPRGRRTPDLPPPAPADDGGEDGVGVPTAAAGEIGRQLRAHPAAGAPGGPGARRCAHVHLETRSGIGFGVRVDPSALGTEGPEGVGRILRLRIDEHEPLVLPRTDGRTMTLPADGVDAVVVGPCR